MNPDIESQRFRHKVLNNLASLLQTALFEHDDPTFETELVRVLTMSAHQFDTMEIVQFGIHALMNTFAARQYMRQQAEGRRSNVDRDEEPQYEQAQANGKRIIKFLEAIISFEEQKRRKDVVASPNVCALSNLTCLVASLYF